MRRPFGLLVVAVLLLTILVVVPVVGIIETFQDYAATDFYSASGEDYIAVYPTSNSVYLVSTTRLHNIRNQLPLPMTYAAWDTTSLETGYANLFDASMVMLGQTTQSVCTGRTEFKLEGGSITKYCNGVLVGTNGVIGINPSFIEIFTCPGGGCTGSLDNVVIGNTPTYGGDNHLASALPVNYTIQIDMLNPAATGMYGWNPNTNSWTLINSNKFYLQGDKEFLNAENFRITKFPGDAAVINQTTVSGVQNIIEYHISNFITEIQTAGFSPYGQWQVSWENASTVYETFWIIGSGATIEWDRSTYNQGSTATITYTIQSAYWDTATYTYYIKIKDNYGTEVSSQTILATADTITKTLDESNYLDNRIYYAMVYAVKKSDGTQILMNYDYMEMDYQVTFTGYVMNAINGTVINSANVSVNQSGTYRFGNSLTSGLYNISGMLPNFLTNVTTTRNWYLPNIILFTPLMQQTYNMNISLVPTNLTYGSASIGGIIKGSAYKTPISGATAHIMNGTWSSTNITNVGGWYYFDSLLPNGTYYIYGEKYGYVVSANTSVNATVT